MSYDDLRHVLRPAARCVYIAGPMGGLPEFNYPAFHAAEQVLKAEGYIVRNPADATEEQKAAIAASEFPELTPEYQELMRRHMCSVLEAERVFVLPGWLDSFGATREVLLALTLGIPVYRYDPDPAERAMAEVSVPARVVDSVCYLMPGGSFSGFVTHG